MFQLEVFVFKLFTVDRLSAGTIASRKVSALDHEALDDTVEARACTFLRQDKRRKRAC